MPLFELVDKKLLPVLQVKFQKERDVQRLIEDNLGTVFGCQLIQSEFSTGQVHSGRIDTLALSEDGNPVIIEYKNVESSELITQSLYYLAWLQDHKGDFEAAARKAIKTKFDVDWSAIRVICIAPNYKKFDVYAAQVLGEKIELWTFRLFNNNTIQFEEVVQRTLTAPADAHGSGKNPVMVEAGKKAAITKATGSYTVDEHLEGKSAAIREVAIAVEEFIVGLDPSIEVAPKKLYIAYKIAKNIACMEVQSKKILLFLKLDPKKDKGPPKISRDVTTIGHFGTGDLEITLASLEDLELAMPFIVKAYEQIGS
ncbi:MAG: hypothetical protein ING66_15615 [Rhodocyclaceae bacterium]|nr:hypothetical protein [Rhodocyclaceae bacterium]MCA3081535.1 hypothetical protein [Rhodocyclaceae bacterium]